MMEVKKLEEKLAGLLLKRKEKKWEI